MAVRSRLLRLIELRRVASGRFPPRACKNAAVLIARRRSSPGRAGSEAPGRPRAGPRDLRSGREHTPKPAPRRIPATAFPPSPVGRGVRFGAACMTQVRRSALVADLGASRARVCPQSGEMGLHRLMGVIMWPFSRRSRRKPDPTSLPPEYHTPPVTGSFRDAELKGPPRISGVRVEIASDQQINFDVSGANRNSFVKLLKWLPYGYGLNFFDQFRNNEPEQSEDVGMYVTIQRSKSTYAWKGGNHGWSTPWTRQTRKFLAEWLERNLKPAGARPRPLTEIQVKKEPRPPFDRW